MCSPSVHKDSGLSILFVFLLKVWRQLGPDLFCLYKQGTKKIADQWRQPLLNASGTYNVGARIDNYGHKQDLFAMSTSS